MGMNSMDCVTWGRNGGFDFLRKIETDCNEEYMRRDS